MGGGDKALRLLGGRTLLDRVIERVRPQVAALVLNANGDPARFAGFGLPVVARQRRRFRRAARRASWPGSTGPPPTVRIARWSPASPTDAPFLPRDLVARLVAGMTEAGADLACAASGGQPHPVIGLWPVRLREDLRRALVDEGIRKVDVWTGRYRLATVDFPVHPVDPFFNANRPEDLDEAATLIGRN